MPAITARLNFRARALDQQHAQAIAANLKAAGTTPTPTAILRHALAIAAAKASNPD